MLTKQQLKDAKNCKITQDCIDCYLGFSFTTECVRATAQTALTLLDMLERLEYSNLTWEGQECSICAGNPETGHAINCDLGNLLRGVKG